MSSTILRTLLLRCAEPLPHWRRALTDNSNLIAALLLYSNGMIVLRWHLGLPWAYGLSHPLDVANLVVALPLIVGWAVTRGGLTAATMGLRSVNLLRDLAVGVGTGVLTAAPPLAFFLFPIFTPGPVTWAGAAHIAREDLWVHLLVPVLLGTALFEEVVFRGVLDARLRMSLGLVPAAMVGSGVFVFWHLAVHSFTLYETNLPGAAVWFRVLAFTLGLLPYWGAGLIFTALRHGTGGLAAPVSAHWTVNSLMVAFFVLRD